MKRLIGFLLVAAIVFTGSYTGLVSADTTAETEQFTKDGIDFVKNIDAGWNLGNTLECYEEGAGPLEQETVWNNTSPARKAYIDKVSATGFNAVRIPVTWGYQTNYKDGVYTLNTTFLNRVKEVVSWCYDHDMYVIVNMHHDDQTWLNISATGSEWEEVKNKYRQIWEQVAVAFKDYDEHLILEGGNEILATYAFDGCGDSQTGKCWWGHNKESFKKQNELYQIFYETVRSSGGNNDKRYLMLPTYGAQWYENQVSRLYLPENDTHMIMDIHWYNYSDQMKENVRKSYADIWYYYAYTYKIGVVIGECGFYETTSASTKVSWANSFVKDIRRNYKIPVFLWDDGGDMRLLERSTVEWTSRSESLVTTVVNVSKLVYGDVNQDGNFSLLDVFQFIKYLKKDTGAKKTMPEEADMNKDGSFDMKDLLLMRRKYAEI